MAAVTAHVPHDPTRAMYAWQQAAAEANLAELKSVLAALNHPEDRAFLLSIERDIAAFVEGPSILLPRSILPGCRLQQLAC